MKTLPLIFCGLLTVFNLASAQSTAFTYQGHLDNGGSPASGSYDLSFTLYNASTNGTVFGALTNTATPVSNGLFTTTLDFGGVFTGTNYWLEIAVRTNGNGSFTILQPRQLLTPVPYAIFSANASNAVTALSATIAASAATVPASGIVGTIPTSNLGSNVALLTANGTLPTNELPANPNLTAGIAWQTPSATVIQAQPNIGYLLTNAQQVTITLPASPNVGDIVEVAGAGLGGWVLTQNPSQTIAASFSPVSISGDASGNWYSIAASADGTKLAAVSQNSGGSNGYGGVWTSSNSGTNWTQTSALGGYWYSIASSSDGMKLAAVNSQVISNGNVSYPGGIWTSSNAGTNWTKVSALPSGFSGGGSLTVASSSDGTKLALALGINGSGGAIGIWTSSNEGTNWVKTSAPTNVYWTSIASSSDGTKLAAAATASTSAGGIWTSSNSGANWTQGDAPSAEWKSIASSSDGMKLAAVNDNDIYGSGIWISTNGGTNWVPTTAPGKYWQSVASSADGTKLAAAAWGYPGPGGIWTSSNSGTNWVQVSVPTPDWVSTFASSGWQCIASSSDGTALAAGINGGGIWTILNGAVSHQSAPVSGSTMLGTTGFLQGNFGTVIELIYAGGGQFSALYQTGSLSGH